MDDDFIPPNPTDPGYNVFIHNNDVLDGCVIKAASGSNGETKYNVNNQGYVKIRKLKKHFQGVLDFWSTPRCLWSSYIVFSKYIPILWNTLITQIKGLEVKRLST